MLYNRTSPYARSPLLRPQSEQPIFDIHLTETKIIEDEEIIASRSRYLYCFYCRRPCLSKAGKTNHEKSHKRLLLKEKRSEVYKKPKRVLRYICKVCDEEFVSRRVLNKHKEVHREIIECNFCHKTFKDRSEFEYHDAINDGKNYYLLNTHAHRTRSQSRLSCHSLVPEVRSSSCESNFFNGPPSLPDLNLESQKRPGSRSSRLSMSSTVHNSKKSRAIASWIENNQYLNDGGGGGDDDDDDEEDDYEDGSESMVSTQQSDGRSLSRGSMTSDWSESSFGLQNQYICSEEHCMKTFPSLNWVTTHEMVEHKKLALFGCRECRQRFITSEHLRQHLIHKHPNVSICVLCDNSQRSLAAIHEHFRKHQNYSVKCEMCGKSFISKYYLRKHLKKHSVDHELSTPIKSSILIRIDRRETKEYVDLNAMFHTYPSSSDFSYTQLCCQELNNCEQSDLLCDFTADQPWRS